MSEFEERLSLLKEIRDLWANGKKVTMKAVSVDDTGLICNSFYVDLTD